MGDDGKEREKCFVIMPISDQGDYPSGHFTKVYEQIFKPAIIDAGYEPFRVDEDQMSTPIIGKIFKGLRFCPVAICDLSNKNPNVLYELGIRQAYDQPVVLVKDEKTTNIFDVSGINTVMYSSSRLYETVMDDRKKISAAIKATVNGRTQSIIKIVQAEQAQYPTENLTEQDSIRIMLSSIMNEVSAIKQAQNNDYFQQRNNSVENYKTENVSIVREIYLKQGITKKEILTQLDAIRNIGILKSYTRTGNKLIVEFSAESKARLLLCERILLEMSDGSHIVQAEM